MYCGHLSMAALLLDRGADPAILDRDGLTALQVCSLRVISADRAVIGSGSPSPLWHAGHHQPRPGHAASCTGSRTDMAGAGGCWTVQHSCHAFGVSTNYQLGFAVASGFQHKPRRIEGLSGRPAAPPSINDTGVSKSVPCDTLCSIRSVALDQYHSAAVTADGCLYTWGHGSRGRLGHGDEGTQITPRRVQGVLVHKQVHDVALGGAVGVARTGNIVRFTVAI